MKRHSGFTLIEVLAVLVVLGLLAGATAWSLADTADRATAEEVFGRIAHADRLARIAAERTGQNCVLRYDLDAQQMRRVLTDADGTQEAGHVVGLPKGLAIDRIVVHQLDRVTSHERGDVTVAYSARGRSISYAVRVAHDGTHTWLIFAGLTGQMTVTDHEREVDNLFALLAGGRPDAD